jgi:tetratricopeptide (TPR) repeat protein
VQKVGIEVKDRLNLAVGEASTGQMPANFAEVVAEAISYPLRSANPVEAETKVKDYARHYFEEVWADRPMKALGGASPRDAAGSKLMRKRLLGVLRFLDDCLKASAPARRRGEELEFMEVYDFGQLRHKLGLGDAPVASETPTGQPRDFAGMSAADLAAVPLGELTVAELADGMRAAMKLDAREFAVAYARAAVARPHDPAYADRFPFYLAIANALVAGNDSVAAVTLLAEGADFDAQHNDGKRAADFGRHKGKVLARSNDLAGAAAAYQTVIDANPDDPRNYVDAAETMLRAKDKTRAIAFAEAGLAKAQSLGNRDLEGACKEIVAAAKR